MSYLGNLTFRLTAGATRLPDEFRRRHAAYLAASQRGDGGFAGRQGGSDLYYTGFALRGLTLLGALTEQAAGRAATFLQSQLGGNLAPVDFLSLVFSSVLLELSHGFEVFARQGIDRNVEIPRRLAPLQRSDGGFAKTAQSGQGSTYHTFLSVACLQLIGAAVDRPERIGELIRARRRDDGGYAELDVINRGGTNPTAAAVALLRLLKPDEPPLPAADCRPTIQFLARMQTADGGLRANAQIPAGDLLSTCTGLVALADLDGLDAVNLDRATRFALNLENAGGGFRGGGWDSQVDAEYTFYGLATRAFLATA
ncbi:MAG: prenyltransferase/squalene oxidase repeat-containing protein [Pirellulales bacterium]|nr:prenyltransferase/squalene oxidase repeat-containing protein [Pirellulales bacterium]